MTDYTGISQTGKGRVGGLHATTLSNLTYSKTIGLDILAYNDRFSFDVEVTSTLKPVGNKKSTIPSASLQNYSSSSSFSSGA
jgi:hypothetical protein